MPNVDLSDQDVRSEDLSYANLTKANTERSKNEKKWIMTDVKADSRTICPNGKKWGTAGNNCGF